MNFLIKVMIKFGLLKEDLDYHLIRASMVIIFFFFGYQKWFEYEAQTLIPYISNGPLIFGCTRFLEFAARVGFWECLNGYFARCCSRDSGTRNWEFLARSVQLPHSSEPSPLFRSCQMAGLRLPADFRQ